MQIVAEQGDKTYLGICIECYYGKCRGSGLVCTRLGNSKSKDYDDTCSKFISDEANSCFECKYAEINFGIFATKEKDSFCTKKSRRISGQDLACNSFVED